MVEIIYFALIFLTELPQLLLAGNLETYTTISTICSNGYFQCANTTKCIAQKRNCDEIIDCPNGDDELDCVNVHIDNYVDHMFRKNPAAIHDDFIGGCLLHYSGKCTCRANEILCAHKNFTEIPLDLPQKEMISLLHFEGNNFSNLSSEFLKPIPKYVETLNFVHCNIVTLEAHTFENVSKIRFLYLSNNGLTVLERNLFSTHNELRHLYIMYNHISSIHQDAFRGLGKLTELDLRGNKITEITSEVFAPLKKLLILYLQNNQIQYVSARAFPTLPLMQLSLMGNKIKALEKECFSTMPTLQHLYLSKNRLERLENKTFYNLSHLEDLRLSDNHITTIELGVFEDLRNLTSLHIEKNPFKTLDKRVLQPLTKLDHIYFERFELCKSARFVRDCHPKGDGISSHDHLLDNPLLRTSVWVIGAIGCTGNIIVLLGRLLAPNNNVVHSLYLRNLALSDLLMGVYLFTIAIADLHFRGVYIEHEEEWRHSDVCNFCGFLSTLSCESSVFILSLVTWDRFISVTQPLARKQPSPKTAALTLVVLWSVAALVASAPLAKGYFGDEFYGNNGVCLPLHIHDPYAMGWEYSAAMFMLVNAVALAFICYAYLRMINEIRASGVACRSTRQSQERDKVAQRFGIIVLSDCLCWVPVIIVKLIALTGNPIPQDVYAWIAIFILPINSALNPVLYTLTTTVFKRQMRKIVESCIHRKRRAEPINSASESGFSLSFGFPLGSTRRVLSYRVESDDTELPTNTKHLSTPLIREVVQTNKKF